MNWTDKLVTGTELEAAKRERMKSYEFTTQVVEAQSRYEKEGWEFDKGLKNDRVKLKKPKPADVQFENRVWMMFYKLGFTTMNRDNNFVIEYEDNGSSSSKQIDVIAIDDEIVILVECKHADKPGTKGSFKTVIEAIDGYRRHVFSKLRTRYPNHKMVCAFATSNYLLGDADLNTLKHYNVHYFSENTVEYYETLGKTLGKAAKYQLLGSLFAGKEISGMNTKVPAIRGKMGGKTYFSFAIEPAKLLKLAYILHRNSAQPDEILPAYQRLIKRPRLKSVTNYVNNGGFFPNSIIVNVTEDKPHFSPAPKTNQPTDSESRIGILELPKQYRSIYIIDGQHRLYGYAESNYANCDVVPVVAFFGMNNSEQIKMFMDINENQKSVPQTLRTTLNSDVLWDADDMSDRQKALRSRIAQDLGEKKTSPLWDRIIVGENSKGPKRSITLPFIDSAIERGGFLGRYKNGALEYDGLFEYADISKSYGKIYSYLEGCFRYIANVAPAEWDRPSSNGAVFTVNVGVSATICVCADILRQLAVDENIDIRSHDVADLIEHTQFYLQPLVQTISNLDIEDRKTITKNYGGNGPKECLFRFRQIIHESIDEFCPDGLLEWIRDHSKQFNSDTEQMIDSIQRRIFSDFRSILSNAYGESWQRKGLDQSVYAALSKRSSERTFITGENSDLWQEATLTDCRKIATWSHNWSKLFKAYFDDLFDDGKRRNKSESTEWMLEIDRVYQHLHQMRGYSVTQEEYQLVLCYYHRLIN